MSEDDEDFMDANELPPESQPDDYLEDLEEQLEDEEPQQEEEPAAARKNKAKKQQQEAPQVAENAESDSANGEMEARGEGDSESGGGGEENAADDVLSKVTHHILIYNFFFDLIRKWQNSIFVIAGDPSSPTPAFLNYESPFLSKSKIFRGFEPSAHFKLGTRLSIEHAYTNPKHQICFTALDNMTSPDRLAWIKRWMSCFVDAFVPLGEKGAPVNEEPHLKPLFPYRIEEDAQDMCTVPRESHAWRFWDSGPNNEPLFLKRRLTQSRREIHALKLTSQVPCGDEEGQTEIWALYRPHNLPQILKTRAFQYLFLGVRVMPPKEVRNLCTNFGLALMPDNCKFSRNTPSWAM